MGQFGKTSQRTNEIGRPGWRLEVSLGPVEDRMGVAYKRESLQRAFSLFSDFPQCALSVRDWLFVSGLYFSGEVQFLLTRNSVCVYGRPLCMKFNSGLKAVSLRRKYGKGTIFSLQGCHVKKDKQGSFFPLFLSVELPLHFCFILSAFSLSITSAFSFSYQHTHTHTANP